MLLGRQQVAAAAPVVQRLSYGLDRQTSQDKYVDQAVKLWTTQPGMSLKNFANSMMKTIGVELNGYGVPLFGWTFVSGAGASGLFDSKAWKVQVNVSKFSSRTIPKTLKDLTVAEVTEVVGTLYHESRHTDQDVLIIREQLDQKKTADQIFADTKIRRDVIKAVAASKYSNPLDADQIAHAKRMFDVMYGAHKELLEFLMRNSAAFEGLDTLAAPTSKLSAAAAHIKTFAAWQSAVLQPKLKQMKAMKSPTPAETALLQRLQLVDTSLTNLMAGWKKVAGVKAPAQADVDDVRDLAADARDAIFDAYVKLEGEQDAIRVEDEIKTAFTSKVAKP
ncbi:hypothetical protein F1D05_02625 [Kribbella qitaiheensis]|uniref:Uncharacterized protein n=1 Tax=Kribbella qitaiheensis TaxID=1544730 RepID=A0A7G6WSP1_9ACTN|nr:hypothetical protein [Kribbella qitaiheensis]QNE17006.1 hypothetical protein F1D05_02625 [Kribbella qitaiheensis]